MRHLVSVAVVLVAVELPSVALAQDAPPAPTEDRPRSDTPRSDTPRSDTPRSDTPRSDTPRSDTPRSNAPRSDTPRSDTPRSDTPRSDTPRSDTATSDASKTDTPKGRTLKGRIVDPWARIPRPRGKLRLPDPRRAAEKATARGTVAPAPAEPVVPAEPPPEAQVTAEPAAASVPVTPAVTIPALPPPKTPFGTTTYSVVRPPPSAPHEGLTLEAGTGMGWIYVSDKYNKITSPGGVAGLSIGIGAWLEPSVALTARIAGSSVPSSQGLVIEGFLGPSLQVWVAEHTWVGLGFGLSSFGIDADGTKNDYSLRGYSGDIRVGHTFYSNGKHTLNASFELTPGSVSEELEYGGEFSLTVASIGLLFGWQYL